MRKPVPAYTDMIDLPDDPGEAPAIPVQADEQMAVQSYEHTDKPAHETESVERVEPVKAKARAETPRAPKKKVDSSVPSRREAARLRREAPKVEPADYDQRSLYARAETFERFRVLAFERRTTMQAMYREGLLLVLEKYGVAKGMGPDDV